MTSPDKLSLTTEPVRDQLPTQRMTWQEYAQRFKELAGRDIDYGDTDAAGLELEAICYPDKGSDAANEIEALLSDEVKPLFDDVRRLERDIMYHELDMQLDPELAYEHFLLPASERTEIMERLANILEQRLSGVEDPDTETYVAMWTQNGQAIPLRELSAHDLLVLSVAIWPFSRFSTEEVPDTDGVRRIKEIIERDNDATYLLTIGAIKLAVDGQLQDHESQRIMLGNPDSKHSPPETA